MEWVEKEKINDLTLWEGDRVMFHLLEERDSVFSLKLRYEGDKLLEAVVMDESERGVADKKQ